MSLFLKSSTAVAALTGRVLSKAHLNGCRQTFCRNMHMSGRHRRTDDRTGSSKKEDQLIPDINVNEAIAITKRELESLGIDGRVGELYVGIGQYFSKPQKDRVFVFHSPCTFGQPMFDNNKFETPKLLLDCSIESMNVDKLMDELGTVSTGISHGEVNSVYKGDWTHGFILGKDFVIFSKSSNTFICLNETHLKLNVDNQMEKIPVSEIKSVKLFLSEEPWNEQAIELERKNETISQIVGYRQDNDHRDLAMLMVDTEWSVKAAALLCLKMRKLGHPVALRLPKVLTVQGNPWVENRHDVWTRFSTSI